MIKAVINGVPYKFCKQCQLYHQAIKKKKKRKTCSFKKKVTIG